jgi:hypothetical protein
MMLSTTLLAIVLFGAAIIGIVIGYSIKSCCSSKCKKSKCCDQKAEYKKEGSSCCSSKRHKDD